MSIEIAVPPIVTAPTQVAGQPMTLSRLRRIGQTRAAAGCVLPGVRGYLLLEALMAILLFSVGILAMVATQAHASRHIDDANHRGLAAHLAQELIAAMWADDPNRLSERYDDRHGGTGYRDFAILAQRLPGAASAGNAPEVKVENGPSASSRKVAIALRWQMPGEAGAHRYATTAVIGRN